MKRNELTNAMKVVVASMVQLLKDGKTDEEILLASKADKIGDKDCTDEMLSELLRFSKEDFEKESAGAQLQPKVASPTKMIGNKDQDKKYPFPSSWGKMVVVRESILKKIGDKEKDVIEVPSSVVVKPFDSSLYETHVKQGMFKNKKVEILHDPR